MSRFSKNWLARFAVDGGITSGLCWGVFPKNGDMKEQIARARKGGNLTFKQVHPYSTTRAHKIEPSEFPEVTVALQIYDLWFAWNEQLKERGLYPTRVILEDFNIRPGGLPTGERFVLSSVRVVNLFMGMMLASVDAGMEWLYLPKMYDPSQSKNFATNPRMKNWGMWERGMGTDKLEHAGDAARLIALDLAEEKRLRG